MTCSCCFGVLLSKPHATRTSCELSSAIAASRCFDCGSSIPCTDKTCLSRTHSTMALWAWIRDKSTYKSMEDARKAYGISDLKYNGPPARVKNKDAWVPAHIAAVDHQLIFVVKGVPIPAIFADPSLLSSLLVDGATMRSHSSLEGAINHFFADDIALGDEKGKSAEEASPEKRTSFAEPGSSKELEDTCKLLAEQSKKLEELMAKSTRVDIDIPSLKDIRDNEREVARILKASNPLGGAVESLLKTDATAFSHTLDSCTPLLKGIGTISSLNKVSFRVKDYVRDGKESAQRVELKDGVLQIVKKRKKVLSSF